MDGSESILTSIKKLLGIDEMYTQFDMDLVLYINSIFSVLTQLGVGPSDGFAIDNEDALWTDFTEDNGMIEMVKTYIYLRVRLLFDPPTNSFVVDSLERQVSELEWRIQVAVEPYANERRREDWM